MAFTTVPIAGSKLRASVLSALITELRPITAFKSTTTSRASTVTLTADPDLTVSLPANSTWDWELMLVMTSDANAAGDFNAEFAFPAGATVSYGVEGLVDTLASGVDADLRARGRGTDSVTPTSPFEAGCSTAGTTVLVSGRITLGSTAGSLTLNWAQLSSNVNATNLFAGSRLVAHRVD